MKLSSFDQLSEPGRVVVLLFATFSGPCRGEDESDLNTIMFLPKDCPHLFRRQHVRPWPTGERIEQCEECEAWRARDECQVYGWVHENLEEGRSACERWIAETDVDETGRCPHCADGQTRHLVAIGGAWRCPVLLCRTQYGFGSEPWER